MTDSNGPGCLASAFLFALMIALVLAALFAGMTLRNHVVVTDQFRHELLACNARHGRLVTDGPHRFNGWWGPNDVPAYRCLTP